MIYWCLIGLLAYMLAGVIIGARLWPWLEDEAALSAFFWPIILIGAGINRLHGWLVPRLHPRNKR